MKLSSVLVIAAALTVQSYSFAQSTNPPRLIVKYGSGEHAGKVIKAWDSTKNFASVPSNMKAKGEEVCSALNAKAVGYHPRAQDENGNQIVDGGFLCER